MRKTKIICTLGPNCRDEKTLSGMLLAGMDVARLNFSHQDHNFHKENISLLKSLREKTGQPLALLLDTKGPEIRTGVLAGGEANLLVGNRVTLSPDCKEGNSALIPISYRPLYKSLKKGDILLLDDGKIQLAVENIIGEDILCEILQGGVLGNRRGINIPNTNIDMPFISETDRRDILLGIEQGVDYIAASFVRCGEDVKELRSFLNQNGGTQIGIISKIECRRALDNFDEILYLSDGIMVARGDLGVEIPFEQLPAIQKQLINKCFKSGKTAITATQMLESMITNPFPTRAEISDVANAVFDRTSAVMLSGETAIGHNPPEVVKTMARICEQAERDIESLREYKPLIYSKSMGGAADAICAAAATAAENINAAAVIAATKTGRTARFIAKYRPDMPIIAATASKKVFNQLSINWGITPIMIDPNSHEEAMLTAAKSAAIAQKLIKKGETAVLVSSVTRKGKNLLKIAEI